MGWGGTGRDGMDALMDALMDAFGRLFIIVYLALRRSVHVPSYADLLKAHTNPCSIACW